jgi:outer membrane protein
MRKTLLGLTIATLFVAMTAPASAEDLLQLYREAKSKDATLASAKYSWQAVQEKVPQAEAGLKPNVGVAGSAQYIIPDQNVSGTGLLPKATQVNSNIALNATVSASQPLYRRQNQVVLDQAKVQVAQSDYVLRSVDQDLAIRLAQAYFDVLLAQDTLEFVGAQKAATAESLAQAKRNFEVGTATITDTNEAQARYDQIVALEIATLNDIEIKRRAIEVIIGRNPPGLKPLGPKPVLVTPSPDNLDAWSARAEQSNLAILIANASLNLATLEVDRNRAAREMVVDAIGSYGHIEGIGLSSAYANSTLRQWAVGVQLSMPLYTGGLIDSRVREALANQEKARQDVEVAKRSAAQSARTSFLNVSNGIAQVKALEQALVSAEVALASSKLGMEVGVRTNVDVLNAQQQVFSARRDLAKARYDVITNSLRLKAAAGELTEADIEAVNRALS